MLFQEYSCSLEGGQERLRVLLSTASSWTECSGTPQLCWEASRGADVNFGAEKELPSETVQELVSYFWVGDLTCQVVQQLKQIFFGEVYEESFLSVCCFFFLCEFCVSPSVSYSPPPHLEASLQAVISKAGLGYLWKCLSLVIHWKVSYVCGARKGLKLAEVCQARFGYQRLITNENRWGWLRWEVLALFWGTSEQEFQEHWLFVLLRCKKSDDGLSLMSASNDVFPTWRCSLHPTLPLCFE